MKDKNTLIWICRCSGNQFHIMVILILINALYAGCGVVFALACKSLVDTAFKGEGFILLWKGLYLLLVILFQFILRILSRMLEVRIQGRMEMYSKTTLFEKLLKKDYTEVKTYHSGELLNRLTADITIISEGVATILPQFSGQLTRLAGALAVLCVIDSKFTLAFLFGGLIIFLSSRYFRNKLKDLHKRMQERDGLVRSFLQEAFEDLLIIKIYGIEERMKQRAVELQTEHYIAKMAKNKVSIYANTGFSMLFALGYLYALLWGSFQIVTNAISFGTLTAILQLVGQIQVPFSGLSGLMPKIYGVIASAERIMELEALPDEIEINTKEVDALSLYNELQTINLNEVSFCYDREYVLHKVNLIINKGDLVLITGRSGIGKSTLLKLILGVLIPLEGEISVYLNNGSRILIDRYIRKLFAYVPQRNLMLSGTIRENITLFNTHITKEKLIKAAKLSCSMEFIEALPLGFETVIGEKGQGLSEGQLQRIAIARAILCEAPVLLLDEATSALDETTEVKLLNNIKEMTDKTCILISHKKAALDVCNKTIHIENQTVIMGRRGQIENKLP